MYTSSINRIALTGTLLTIVSIAGGGCSSIDRFSQIGEQPKLSSIDNPTTQPGYKPVQMPMPKPEAVSYNANSLWRNGSRSFFKDQRAHQIGDLLTVSVNITDQANFANETIRSRTVTEDSGITAFLGSKMHAAGVRCVDCHEPHSAKRLFEGNNLCMRCHNGSFKGSPVIVPEQCQVVRPDIHPADGPPDRDMLTPGIRVIRVVGVRRGNEKSTGREGQCGEDGPRA